MFDNTCIQIPILNSFSSPSFFSVLFYFLDPIKSEFISSPITIWSWAIKPNPASYHNYYYSVYSFLFFFWFSLFFTKLNPGAYWACPHSKLPKLAYMGLIGCQPDPLPAPSKSSSSCLCLGTYSNSEAFLVSPDFKLLSPHRHIHNTVQIFFFFFNIIILKHSQNS